MLIAMHGNFLEGNEKEREDANIGATTSSICAFGKNRLVTDLQYCCHILPILGAISQSLFCFQIAQISKYWTITLLHCENCTSQWRALLSFSFQIVLPMQDVTRGTVSPLCWARVVDMALAVLPADPVSSPSSPASLPQPVHGQPQGRREAGKLHGQLWNAALCKCRSARTGRGLCFVPRVKAKVFQGRRLGEGSGKQLAASQWKRSMNVRKQQSKTKNAQLINTTQVGNTGQAQWQGKAIQKWGQMRKQDLEFWS